MCATAIFRSFVAIWPELNGSLSTQLARCKNAKCNENKSFEIKYFKFVLIIIILLPLSLSQAQPALPLSRRCNSTGRHHELEPFYVLASSDLAAKESATYSPDASGPAATKCSNGRPSLDFVAQLARDHPKRPIDWPLPSHMA